jgi:hypothetical protein
MKRPSLQIWVVAVFWCALSSAEIAVAGDVAAPVPQGVVTSGSSVLPPRPPLPPFSPTPVDLFRRILAMTPTERDHFLANRQPENRKAILEKVKEYEAMQSEDRELRLTMTQLRWYMLRFMRIPPTNRPALLALVPEADRWLVATRLQIWDLLPPGLQKEVFEYGTTLQYFVGPDASTRQAGDSGKEVESVRASARLSAESTSFFDLTEREKRSILSRLSPLERAPMEKAMVAFARLPQAQREECLRSYAKFSHMNSAEQNEFLQNAERWNSITPAERQAWRRLATLVPAQPPLPPGFVPARFPSRDRPPFPPAVARAPAPNSAP